MYMTETLSPVTEARSKINLAIFRSVVELQLALAEEMRRYLSETIHVNLRTAMMDCLGVPPDDFVVSVVSQGGSTYIADIQIIGESVIRLRQQLNESSERPLVQQHMSEVGKNLRKRLRAVYSATEQPNEFAHFVLGTTNFGEPADFRIEQRFALHFQVMPTRQAVMSARSAIAQLSLHQVLESRQAELDLIADRTTEDLIANTSTLEEKLADRRGQSIAVLGVFTEVLESDDQRNVSVYLTVSNNPVGVDVLSNIANWVEQTLELSGVEIDVEPPTRLSRLSRAIQKKRNSSGPNSEVFTVLFKLPR